MSNITRIPSTQVPVIDVKTGLITRDWFMFFQNLFTLLGSGSSDDVLADFRVAPQPQVDSGSLMGLEARVQALEAQSGSPDVSELQKDVCSLLAAPVAQPVVTVIPPLVDVLKAGNDPGVYSITAAPFGLFGAYKGASTTWNPASSGLNGIFQILTDAKYGVAGDVLKSDGSYGAIWGKPSAVSGTFTTVDLKTVTVTYGIVTGIV